MTIRNLERLLRPASVAVIGASTRPASVGALLAANLLKGGFAGPVDLVNRKRPVIHGRKASASVSELAQAPDLAVIATPPATIPGIIDELGRCGTKAAVVITAGVSAELRQRMLDAARQYCLRIIGPNNIGLMVPGIGLNASFSHIPAPRGDLAFLSQSGALITGILDWAADRRIGFSHVVSLGDMADVDFGDMLDYLAGDAGVRAILIYMEALTAAPKFMSAARRAARVKPVIVVKSGRHAAGAKAAQSHTGALAGLDAAYDAAFRRAGLLRVTELDDLFNAAAMLSRAPRVAGERIAILTNGGGAGVLAADRAADFDTHLTRLQPGTIAALDAVLPATWSKGNPVDIIGDANEVRYRNAMDILLEDPAVDAVLVINCPTAVASSLESAKAVVEATREKKSRGGSLKPVFACWLGDGSARPSRQLFAESAIASFETPENAIEGFVQLVRHRRAQDELLLTPPSLGSGFRVDRKRASGIIKGALAAGRKMLSEDEAKSVLAAYDVPVVATTLARSADEVADAATMILTAGSSAAVIKIVADGVSHKSDVGGVRLGILSGEEARQAAQDMLQRIARLRPGAQVRGFTVQPMIKRSGAHELIVGMSVDPTFGPMMLFGAGGTSVEVEADTSLSLPPLDLKLARQLIRRTRISRLLAGYRDRPAADIAAIELTLVKVSQLIADHPEIRELDINPLLADEQGAIALDARIGVEDAKAHPRAAMALRPYPVEWERHDQIEGIGDVELRPIRPDDEHLYEEFFRHVTQEDARMRFFSPVKGLAHKYLARLTQIDYAREMAFVAIDTNGKLLGVARFIADPDYTSGEYGVIVRSDLKGRGLGWHLMQHLIAYARSEGLQELYGDVLAENVTMLQMCSELGFEISAIADDLTVRRVRLHLPGGGHRNS